jgi:hypothetical protein
MGRPNRRLNAFGGSYSTGGEKFVRPKSSSKASAETGGQVHRFLNLLIAETARRRVAGRTSALD